MHRSLLFSIIGFTFFASSTHAADPDLTPRLVVPSPHGEAPQSIAISPDGRWTLSSAGSAIKLWDTATGTQLGSTSIGEAGTEKIINVHTRNDGQFYVVAENSVTILEVPSLKEANRIESPVPFFTSSVSADGETLHVAGAYGEKSYVHMLRRGRFPLRMIVERAAPAKRAQDSRQEFAPVVSPDGRYALFPQGRKAPYHLVRLEDGELLRTFDRAPTTDTFYFSVGWSSESQLVISKPIGPDGKENQVDVIDPATFEVEWTTRFPITATYHSFGVNAHGLPGQPTILSDIQGVRFLEGNRLDGPYLTTGYYVLPAAFTPDARHVIFGTAEGESITSKSYQLRKFDRARGSFSAPWSAPTYRAAFLAGSPAGDALYISDQSTSGKLIRFHSGGLQVTRMPFRFTGASSFSSEGKTLVYNYGAHERSHAVLEVARPDQRQVSSLPLETTSRTSKHLILSPSGRLAADISPGNPLYIRDGVTGRFKQSLPGGYYSYDAAKPAAFSADDRTIVYFASPKDDRRLFCYDIATGKELWAKSLPYTSGSMVFTNADKQLYVVANYSNRARLFLLDATNGETITESPLEMGPAMEAPAFNPSGTQVAFPWGKSVVIIDLATGKEVRRLTDPGQSAERVSFLGDHQLIATGNDNALRFWGTNTGTLLGTLTTSKEGDDWAFVHPSGRFEATPGFQQEMYFVQGNTKVPLEAYYESFHTPGLLGQLLAGQTVEAPAIALKDLSRPPSVTLELAGTRNLTVEDAPQEVSTEQATLRVTAQSADSKVAEIRLYHNGKLIEARTRNLTVEDDTEDVNLGKGGKQETITVALLPGENTFRAVALNEQRTESKPVELVVDYKAPQAVLAGREGGGLQLHLLIVGINTYKNPKYNLNYAVPDATAVQAAIKDSSAGIFSKVNVTTLLNENATRAALLASFEAIAKQSGPRDVFIFYYAGHGVMSSEAKPEFFLAPHELTQLYGADDQLRAKAISSAEMLSFSQKISAQKQLFLLDACQSAGALTTIAMRGAAEEKAVAQLARASGTHWITASGSEQFASEFEKLGHGTFTFALLEALKGKADNGDGRVTVNELKAFLEIQVPELTKLHKGTPQYPASYGFGQDFPVSVISKN